MYKKSGIYMIKNIKNGDYYIGSSCDIIKRYKTHINQLKKGKHHSIILQRAFNKYGLESFKLKIICFCEKELNLILEQNYIDSLLPLYNISKSSVAPMKGRKHTKDSIKKFKKRKVAKGKDHYLYGKTWSPTQREKLLKARTGIKRSIQFKQKQSYNAIKNKQHRFLKKYIESIKKTIIDQFGTLY